MDIPPLMVNPDEANKSLRHVSRERWEEMTPSFGLAAPGRVAAPLR